MERNQLVLIANDWPTVAPDGCEGRYLALITAVHTTPVPWANAHLCHATPEMAYDHDLVLDAGTVTPYPLVVMGEGYVQVLPRQIIRVIATVPERYSKAVFMALYTDGESVAAVSEQHPTPLGGPLDPRRQWMADYCTVLRDVSTPARRILLD